VDDERSAFDVENPVLGDSRDAVEPGFDRQIVGKRRVGDLRDKSTSPGEG
jgi:hypothetical protein